MPSDLNETWSTNFVGIRMWQKGLIFEKFCFCGAREQMCRILKNAVFGQLQYKIQFFFHGMEQTRDNKAFNVINKVKVISGHLRSFFEEKTSKYYNIRFR